MSVLVYECMSIWVYEYECISIWVYEYECMSMSVWVYECMSVLVWVYEYECISIWVYVYDLLESLLDSSCLVELLYCSLWTVKCVLFGPFIFWFIYKGLYRLEYRVRYVKKTKVPFGWNWNWIEWSIIGFVWRYFKKEKAVLHKSCASWNCTSLDWDRL